MDQNMLTTSSLLSALNKESNNITLFHIHHNKMVQLNRRTAHQSKGLSLQYWAEAINYANYIVNHTPTKFLQGITLEEAWSKIKPYVSHFHVFGCEAWAHISNEKRKALQPKSEKCIFVGYSEDVKGYILLQPHYHDIIISRDVKFGLQA